MRWTILGIEGEAVAALVKANAAINICLSSANLGQDLILPPALVAPSIFGPAAKPHYCSQR